MPNIMPINSLTDLLTIRELKNQANPTYSALKSISDGVAMGIQQKQEDARIKKAQEQELNNTLSTIEKLNKTNSGKIGKLIPKVSMKDGKTSISAEMETPVDQLKIGRENRLIKQQEEMLKQKKLDNATKLRQELEKLPQVKDYVTVSTNVNAMESLLNSAISSNNKQNLVAVDQGIITMYNKLTDPQSVVRESEYARTPGNLPVVNRMIGAINKVQQGGAGLTNDDRMALVEAAKVILKERATPYNEALNEYSTLATQYELDPSMVIKGMKPYEENSNIFKTIEEAEKANLPVGTVIYIGGRKAVVE